MKKVWILTRAENQYDQYGEYFEAVWTEKPTRSELLIFFTNGSGVHEDHTAKEHKFVGRILNGGGREKVEDTWYYLDEVETGKAFEHKTI